MSAPTLTQTPATPFSVCIYRAAIAKLNECRTKCPGIGGDVDVANLWWLIEHGERSGSAERQAARTLESLARGLEITAGSEVEALRALDSVENVRAELRKLARAAIYQAENMSGTEPHWTPARAQLQALADTARACLRSIGGAS